MVPGLQGDSHFRGQRLPLVALFRIVLAARVDSEMVRVSGAVAGAGGGDRGGGGGGAAAEDGAAVVGEKRAASGAVLHRGARRAGFVSENWRGEGGQLFVQVLPEDRRAAAQFWTLLLYFRAAGHVSEKVLLGLLGRLLGHEFHYRLARFHSHLHNNKMTFSYMNLPNFKIFKIKCSSFCLKF